MQSANASSIPPPLWGQLTSGAPRPQKDLAYCWTFPRQGVLVTVYKQRTTTTKGENRIKKKIREKLICTHTEKFFKPLGFDHHLGYKNYFWIEHFLQCWLEADSMSPLLHMPRAMSVLKTKNEKWWWKHKAKIPGNPWPAPASEILNYRLNHMVPHTWLTSGFSLGKWLNHAFVFLGMAEFSKRPLSS